MSRQLQCIVFETVMHYFVKAIIWTKFLIVETILINLKNTIVALQVIVDHISNKISTNSSIFYCFSVDSSGTHIARISLNSEKKKKIKAMC